MKTKYFVIAGFTFGYITLIFYKVVFTTTITESPELSTILVIGLLVTFFIHAKFGLIAITALMLHMILEIKYHASHGFVGSGFALTLLAAHVFFDFIFLTYQSYNLSKRHPWVLPIITLALMLYVAHSYYRPFFGSISLLASHTHPSTVWDSFILGSIIGCLVYHISIYRKALLV